MVSPIYRSQELEDYVDLLRLENEQLKKALLEMKDAAETWKALVESLYRSGRQEATMEDLSRIKDYMDSLKNG